MAVTEIGPTYLAHLRRCNTNSTNPISVMSPKLVKACTVGMTTVTLMVRFVYSFAENSCCKVSHKFALESNSGAAYYTPFG
jgi:hypothetical protein